MTENMNYNLDKYEGKAAEIITRGDSDNILGKAVNMFYNVPALGRLAKEAGDLVGMVKDYISGVYKRVPYATIVKSALALAYVVSPVDAVPDTIPVAGYIDDYAVVRFVAESVEDDVEEYKRWKAEYSG